MEDVNRKKLLELRAAVPFLQMIPDALYFQFSAGDFVIPWGNIEQIRERLEKKLGHFVMPYNRSDFNLQNPLRSHMCATVKGAYLTHKQRMLLQMFEQHVVPFGVSFVVYQKPLAFINPIESNLAVYYQSIG